MTDQPSQHGDGGLISFFMTHIVPVVFTFTKGTNSHTAYIMTFVFSVSDQWFLVSAGHCLKDIEDNITKEGYKISNCVLVDSFGLGAKHYDPIPFKYEDSMNTYINDNAGLDYGVIVLPAHYRRLLEKNNIKPLNEDVWKHQPSEVDSYILLGISNELTKITSESLEITPSLHGITPLDYPPDSAPKTDLPLFYGRINLGELTSIKGMSGGPIFSIKKTPQGQFKYWLTALQSSWEPRSHHIVACPTKLLGNTLELTLLKLSQQEPRLSADEKSRNYSNLPVHSDAPKDGA